MDIGGFFPGDTLGMPASVASDPIQDWFLVAGLTSNITTNTTNDLHYSFLRNWWAWERKEDRYDLQTGWAGWRARNHERASCWPTQNLGPYNVNNQHIRTRFWDGHDPMLRDDISILKGNHLFQVGGIYQHNFNWHQRNDDGGGINEYPVYSLGNGTAGSALASDVPVCDIKLARNQRRSQLRRPYRGGPGHRFRLAIKPYTRSGPNLSLNAPLTPAFDQSTIPYYNVYFSDTWHMKPTFSLTYGLGWALEMPPTEANGKQIVMVDQANQPIGLRPIWRLASARRWQARCTTPKSVLPWWAIPPTG